MKHTRHVITVNHTGGLIRPPVSLRNFLPSVGSAYASVNLVISVYICGDGENMDRRCYKANPNSGFVDAVLDSGSTPPKIASSCRQFTYCLYVENNANAHKQWH